MSQIRPVHIAAPTLEEHNALGLTRPYSERITGGGIGAHSVARRQADAAASAVFTEPDSPVNDASIAGLPALIAARKAAANPPRPSRSRRRVQSTQVPQESTERHTA